MRIMAGADPRATVRLWKSGDAPAGTYGIPILDETGRRVGGLIPVDRRVAQDAQVIASLARWRAMSMKFFFTQFEATPERTGRWVQDVILPDDGKILFLLTEETGRPVGNFAVRDIGPDGAELDNLIRGEAGGGPQLVYNAEMAMLNWLYNELNVPVIRLRLFSNNARTRALHESAGFYQTGLSRMRKVMEKGEVRWEESPADAAGDGVDLLHMEMTKTEFQKHYRDWMRK